MLRRVHGSVSRWQTYERIGRVMPFNLRTHAFISLKKSTRGRVF